MKIFSKKKREEWVEITQLGNFLICGLKVKDMFTHMEIRALQNNWAMRVDIGTPLFAFLTEFISRQGELGEDMLELFKDHIHAYFSLMMVMGCNFMPIDQLEGVLHTYTSFYPDKKESPESDEKDKEDLELVKTVHDMMQPPIEEE